MQMEVWDKGIESKGPHHSNCMVHSGMRGWGGTVWSLNWHVIAHLGWSAAGGGGVRES